MRRAHSPAPRSRRHARGDAAQPALDFGAVMLARAEAEGKRKGERTRERLKAATVRLLEARGYRDLRVTDINEASNVSNALFYVYFPNKDVIAQEVMRDFLVFLAEFPTRESRGARSPDESIHVANLHYARMFKANPGLMRCLFQLVDEIPDFAAHWHAWNGAWIARVVQSLRRTPDTAFRDATERTFAVAALGTMVDGVLRRVYVERDPNMPARVLRGDPEQLAEFLTRLWVRSLFLRDRPARTPS